MDLSIIVVNWNTRDLLAECLDSITRTVERITYEIIVVDNASSDGSQAMVRQRFPQACLIENSENAGFARANNQAIRQSCGKYILLLNSDAALLEETAARLVQAMETNPRAGLVGARLVYPDGRPQASHAPLPTLWSECASLAGLDKALRKADSAATGSAPVPTGMVDGACLMARRSTLDQIGLLDERFFMFNEEVDLCQRAHAAGWDVLHVPGAVTVHVAGGSTGVTPARILRLYKGKLQYFQKHYGGRARSRLQLAMRLVAGGKALFYGLFSLGKPAYAQKKTLWRAVSRGLPTLPVD